jgi:hypothetical protein
MNQLRWVVENGGKYMTEQRWIYLCLLSDGIGGGPGTFFTPYMLNLLSYINRKPPRRKDARWNRVTVRTQRLSDVE